QVDLPLPLFARKVALTKIGNEPWAVVAVGSRRTPKLAPAQLLDDPGIILVSLSGPSPTIFEDGSPQNKGKGRGIASGDICALATLGTFVLAGTESGSLYGFNISNPERPVVVNRKTSFVLNGTVRTPAIRSIQVRGGIAVLGTDLGLVAVDIRTANFDVV